MKKCDQTCHPVLCCLYEDKYSFTNTYKNENKSRHALRIKDITKKKLCQQLKQ